MCTAIRLAQVITAAYGGDANFAASTAMLTQQVVTAPPVKHDSASAFDPNTALWYLHDSNAPGSPDVTPFGYGEPGWLAVVGDWSGAGRAHLA